MCQSLCLTLLHSTTSILERIKIENERKKLMNSLAFQIVLWSSFHWGTSNSKKTSILQQQRSSRRKNRMRIEDQKSKPWRNIALTWFTNIVLRGGWRAIFYSYSLIVLVLTERPGKPVRQKRESLPNQSGPFLLGNSHFFQEQVLSIPAPVRGRHCLAEELCKQSFILQGVRVR